VGQVNFAYTNSGGAASHITTPLPMTGGDQATGKINNALFIVADPTKVVGGTGARAVGGNHPFSFPYAGVAAGGNTYNGITSAAGNNFVTPALVLSKLDGEALRGGPGTYGIECASCHDTHAQADPTKSSTFPSHLGQMVRVGMDNSSLCFACHIR
ncbi:MAG: cytochrome c3 family protein, partial [Acidobacteriota bacterium]|nr:cytochrome c3 family protein [Acidobacteriota bacterium]